ncbi:MAG: class II aldolase/adducin family protein [Candidatus Omnitrophica bacterium]|nr:class II aldolase/adducin family protein [Candidatus Omnitrophota bacterium]
MMDKTSEDLKQQIISSGKLLWDKSLVGGLNGNISARVDASTILLTATGTCLGMLTPGQVLQMRLDGTMIDDGHVSTEKLLHTEIYKNFPEAEAVVHTHTTYTNAFFLGHERLSPRIFESRIYLGEVAGIVQQTPAVTDAGPVIEALKKNNIVVLRNHGVVAMGKSHFDCFLLIQALEEAAHIDILSRLYEKESPSSTDAKGAVAEPVVPKKYKLFSKEQMDEIVKNVNADTQMKNLGAETNMTFDLAVLLDETGEAYSFQFDKGYITNVRPDAEAEFVVSAPERVWRQVFNREIDPFVATTQKKMKLAGDFAKISKWYAPCSRVFEIWAQVPVE